MATVATSEMRQLASDWKTQCGLSGAVISGIVGDLAHKAKGGYHISRQDQPGDNYSVVRPDDRSGRSDAAAAIDMTLNKNDMITVTSRLVLLYDNMADPRRKYINAFNGTRTGATATRWDVYARETKVASNDHLWHVHLEVRRAYTESLTAMAAILSGLKGESLDSYLRSIGVTTGGQGGGGVLAAPAYPGRMLVRNDSQKVADAALKLFVGRMLQRGWSSFGTNDGFFGPKVEAGVKKWQAYVGLGADGKIGPKTWPTPWTKPMAA